VLLLSYKETQMNYYNLIEVYLDVENQKSELEKQYGSDIGFSRKKADKQANREWNSLSELSYCVSKVLQYVDEDWDLKVRELRGEHYD
jgi:hypothetical protein